MPMLEKDWRIRLIKTVTIESSDLITSKNETDASMKSFFIMLQFLMRGDGLSPICLNCSPLQYHVTRENIFKLTKVWLLFARLEQDI